MQIIQNCVMQINNIQSVIFKNILMNTLPYTVIKTVDQYNQYCNELEALVVHKKRNKQQQDTIELLTLLIEKWDETHNSFEDADPVELLRYLMRENQLKSVELAKLLDSGTSLVSDILNYRRGMSKDMIRKLSDRFKISQSLFNRPYTLITPVNSNMKTSAKTKAPKKRSVA